MNVLGECSFPIGAASKCLQNDFKMSSKWLQSDFKMTSKWGADSTKIFDIVLIIETAVYT